MTGWLAAGTSSYFYVCYVADCGPYLGPSTCPPPEILPPGYTELDYYIGLPAASGNVLDFNGTGGVQDAYRYASGTGSSGAIPAGTPHLFLAAYPTGYPRSLDGIAPPTVMPLKLVTKGLVAGASGPYRTAPHYSPWITYGIDRFDVGQADALRQSQSLLVNTPQPGYPSTVDTAQMIENERQAALGYDPANPSTTWPYTNLPFPDVYTGASAYTPNAKATSTASKQTNPSTSNVGSGSITIEASTMGWPGGGWQGVLDPNPPAMQGLVRGVDCLPVPGGGYVEWESSTTTFEGWDDLDTFVSVLTDAFDETLDGNSGAFSHWNSRPAPPVFHLNIYYAPAPASGAAQSWYGPAPGTLLQTINLDPNAHGWTFDSNNSPSWVQPVTLELSRIPYPDFMLFFQPGQWGSEPFAQYDLPVPTGYDRFQEDLGFQGTFLISSGGGVGLANPKVKYALPRYRYLIPGELVYPPSEGFLRLNQRADGRGLSAHPRLRAAQSPNAPRVGGRNQTI